MGDVGRGWLMAAGKGNSPIIIKRITVSGGGGHHGGAWKVAYADFVTAMMAFFLLMWLLNATTEKQRQGLADYFDPTILNSPSGAAGGIDSDGPPQTPTEAAQTQDFEATARAISREASAEALSQTRTSSGDTVCARTVARHRSSVPALW